ncbi:MAG: hypothetical protein HY291_13195 [Planctomycetes bacterium]|nr:hypothetical protein [Planctomycetota bacterium]
MKNVSAAIALAVLLVGCDDAQKPMSAARPAPSADPLFNAMRQVVETRYRKNASDEFVAQIVSASVIQAVDLNGDRVPERLVDVQYRMDSTGNRGFYVLSQKDGTWSVIGEMGGDTFRVLKAAPGSYADIETVWNNADGTHVRRIYRFDGVRYLESVQPAAKQSASAR